MNKFALGLQARALLLLATRLLLPGGIINAAVAQSEPRSTPAQVAAALPELERLANQFIANGEVPGMSVAIVHQDRVVYLKGFGVKKIGEVGDVNEDTVFQLASMSKPISATIVSALVSQGLLTWDSRISDLDPAFQLYDPLASRNVTVRDMFAHRSGLPGNAGNVLEAMGYSREEILYRTRFVEPASSLRSAYSYSNFGITEGAVAAARTTGLSWEEVAENMLYKPLGMTSTSSRHADFLSRANRATLHAKSGTRWAALATRNPNAQSPAGGVSSSARDLAQWIRLELARGKFNGTPLISEAALAETHLPTIGRGANVVNGRPTFYGLGWVVDYENDGSVRWAHAGAFSNGAQTFVSLNPDDQLGIVVLTNAFPNGVPEGLASSLYDLVYLGRIQQDWMKLWQSLYNSAFGPEVIAAATAPYATKPPVPSAALRPEAYVGNYTSPYADAQVLTENQGLVIKLGRDERSLPLTHFDRDLFVYFPSDETPTLPSAVSFVIGLEGRASQLVLHDLVEINQGALPLARSPRILSQPVAQRTSAGSNVALAVAATGNSPLAYQWRKSGVAIAGATSAVFQLANITSSNAGSYTVTVTDNLGSATSAVAQVSLVTAATSKLKALSARTTLAVNQRLIVGFAVAGGSRPMFLQAVGPGLGSLNLTGFLPDPRLEVFNAGGAKLGENDDWLDSVGATRNAVGAFPVGTSRKDAALIVNATGNNTMQVFGAGSGMVLAEIYDAGTGDGQRLYAVSARHRVGAGDNVLIVGLVVEGTTNRNVLIRGIGPRLADLGVTGVLLDPKIEVYNSANIRIAENDNWPAALGGTIAGTGLSLTPGSRDAALVLSLAPGNYTIQVSGVGATSGEVLADVFELP